MDETQIRKILSKAKELNHIIGQDLAARALEIEELSSSSNRKKLLERLIASLDQYIAKEQHLVYIGFVGHFSSGKSTTINSILKLTGTRDERTTDLNPTDTEISLITDKTNSQKLILMSRESAFVPVRANLIDSAFLQNLVIADTPGSGDPNVVNELIQDFLPICDYILYFISATNPIDEADIPLLLQKFVKLPFIPLKFVVTRSDEFRNETDKPLSEQNINSSKRDSFTGQLISRLKEFAKVGEIAETDFIFIDNIQKYNIEELEQRLLSWSSELDHKAIWKNHSHKLEFYGANLDELESYFLSTIKTKIKITGDFLTTAGENIHKFDAAVELNNEKLRNLWIDGDRALKKALQTEQEKSDLLLTAVIPGSLNNTEIMAFEETKIKSFIEQQSNGYVGRFANVLYQQVKGKITAFKQDLDQIIGSSDLAIEDIRTLLPPRIDLESNEEKLEVDFSKMDDQVINYLNQLYYLADQERLKLISRTDSFLNLVNQQYLINSTEQIYLDGSNTFTENFDRYFDVIEMYKASVLTKNTKDTIQKLRIGRQLDDLDYEFPEQYKQTRKEEAIAAIYPKKDEKSADLKIRIHEIEDQVSTLKRELNIVSVKRDNTVNNFFEKEEFEVGKILQETKILIENSLDHTYQEKLLKVYEQHRNDHSIYIEKKSQQKKQRFLALGKWIGLSTAFGALCFFAVLKLNMVTPNGVVWTLFFGVASSALSGFIGLIIGMLRNDLNKLTERHRQAFHNKALQDLKTAFNEDFFSRMSQSITELRQKKMASLENAYLIRLGRVTNKGNLDINAILSGLFAQNNLLINKVTEYLRLISEFQQQFTGIFSNQEENIGKISAITSQIKQNSIEPSFALIETTKSDLEKVRAEIESVTMNTLVEVSTPSL